MTINLQDCGKHYNRDWIFRNLNHPFSSGDKTAILGPNGSGKSTLLKCISGYLSLNEGKIAYMDGDHPVEREDFYRQMVFSGPYIDLIGELTVSEQIRFHSEFKPLIRNISLETVLEIIGFQNQKNKYLRHLSSGMRQRLKLILTILSDVPCVLLDEPATNLDKDGVKWYDGLVQEYIDENRILIIASNREDEYSACTSELQITDFN